MMFLQRKKYILHAIDSLPVPVKMSVKVLKNQWIFCIQTPRKWLKIPPLQKGRCDFLWQNTCVECFLFEKNAPRYWEYNFSPQGAWALYAFENYRQKTENPVVVPPAVTFWKKRHRTHDVYQIRVYNMVVPPFECFLHFCAVLKNRQNALFYLAQHHFQSKPDFHYFPR